MISNRSTRVIGDRNASIATATAVRCSTISFGTKKRSRSNAMSVELTSTTAMAPICSARSAKRSAIRREPYNNGGVLAIVIGATGAVGSSLVRELIASERWNRIVILARRPVDLFADTSKLDIHVIDLSDLAAEAANAARGCDAAFCTMGVGQPRKMPKDEVWRVDVEYAGAFARGCRAAGVPHISLLSSAGADATSRSGYLRLKGSAENAVRAAGIARTSFFRPSLLVT